MTNEHKRKERMSEIAKGIREGTKKHGSVDKEKLIAQVMMYYGTSRRTTLEYINTLIKADYVKVDGKNLKWKVD